MNKSILIFLYIISLSIGQEQSDTGMGLSPYRALFILSQSKKYERLVESSGMVVTGLLLIAIPYENIEVQNSYRLMGAVVSGMGFAGMIISSKAERSFNSIDKEQSISEKEKVAYIYLVNLARSEEHTSELQSH